MCALSRDPNIRKEILAMRELTWGAARESQGLYLRYGENPFVFPGLDAALQDECSWINVYPNRLPPQLLQLLSSYAGVRKDNIIMGNGSDELIELIAKACIAPGDEVIIPCPSFPAYETVAQMMGGRCVFVDLAADFSLSYATLVKCITPRTKVIWIANPNNPTGNILLTLEKIEKLLQRFKGLLVVDECYFEFSGVTAASLIARFPNLIVLRSFSKSYGLAGVRFGYVLADAGLIALLRKPMEANLTFSVNCFAQRSALTVLASRARAKKFIEKFLRTKAQFESALRRIKGVEVLATSTSFCLIRTPIPARVVVQTLEKERVYIKDCAIYRTMDPSLIYLGVPVRNNFEKVAVPLRRLLK